MITTTPKPGIILTETEVKEITAAFLHAFHYERWTIAKLQLERLSGALSRVTPTARAREILRQQLHRSLVPMSAPGTEAPSKVLSWRAYAWDIYPGATTDSGQVRDILRTSTSSICYYICRCIAPAKQRISRSFRRCSTS